MPGNDETWVARPSDLILPSHCVPLSATRVGGLPAYPAGCQPPRTELTTCQTCGKPLALLLQAHAPLSADQVGTSQAARYLYIFCCTTEGCGKLPGCWKVLRLVMPDQTVAASNSSSSSAAPATPQEQAAAASHPSVAAIADTWGVGTTSDWGVGDSSVWGDEAPDAPDAAFDFGDLNAALEQIGKAPIAAAKASVPSKQAAPSTSKAAPVYDSASPCLPAFYLHAQLESQCTTSSSSKQGPADQDHLQCLAARYEQEESTALGTTAAGDGAASSAVACAPNIEGGLESWGGEGYEEDTVLALPGGKQASVGAAYFKFAKQLARCPDQCARYSFGGCPLWPTSMGPPTPEPCSMCGGPRTFEVQLMTPLIPALAESAEWLRAGCSTTLPQLLQPADSWQWLTVCINTCAASCCSKTDGSPQLVAEEVVLADEE